MIGNPEKASRELGWEAKTHLEELCQMMVTADLKKTGQNDVRRILVTGSAGFTGDSD